MRHLASTVHLSRVVKEKGKCLLWVSVAYLLCQGLFGFPKFKYLVVESSAPVVCTVNAKCGSYCMPSVDF